MSVRFSVDSEAAAKLCRLTFSKLQEVWAPDLEESAVAEYAVALVARGQERKKVHSQLKGVLGEEATVALLDWWVPAPSAAACVWGFNLVRMGCVDVHGGVHARDTHTRPRTRHARTRAHRRLLKYVKQHKSELTTSTAAAAPPATTAA